MILRLIPVPIFSTIAFFIQSYIPGIKNLYPWAFPAIALVVGLAFSVFFVAVRYRLRLTDYETPIISMFFDASDEACNRFLHDGNGLPTDHLLRIGVKATKGKMATGVVVRLAAIEPSIPDLPQALHPMSASRDGISKDWQGDGSFDLRPGDVEYVDVFRHLASDGVLGEAGLSIVFNSFAASIESCSYKLTLTAHAREGQRTTQQFQYEFNKDGYIHFYPLEEVNSRYGSALSLLYSEC